MKPWQQTEERRGPSGFGMLAGSPEPAAEAHVEECNARVVSFWRRAEWSDVGGRCRRERAASRSLAGRQHR